MRPHAYEAQLAAASVHTRHFATDRAIDLLERARTFAGDDRERARIEHEVALANQRVLLQDEAWSQYLRALDLYRGSGDVPLDLYRRMLQAAMSIGAFRTPPADPEIRRIAAEAVDLAHAAGDDRVLSHIERAFAGYLVNRFTSAPEEARPHMEAALAAAERSDDRDALSLALAAQAALLRAEGRVDEALPVLDRIAPVVAEADALDRMNYLRLRSLIESLMGHLERAERAAIDATALAEPMGPHIRTHAWLSLIEVRHARGDWPSVIEIAQRTAKLVRDEKASAFCGAAVDILQRGAIAHALAGQREEALALIRIMPRTNTAEVEIAAGVPRAILGLISPETDERLRAGRRTWLDWADAAIRAVILRRPDEAESAITAMGIVTSRSVPFAALAEAVRELAAELRGGPPATYAALRRIGFDGWAEILSRRVDAGY